MKAISLFSGIGGMDIGFSAAGFNIVAQVEIDSYCRRVLKRHAAEWWKNAKQFTDVCEFGRQSVAGKITVIFGGFPCQPHSVAGARKGAMDSRNLWPEFRRIIGEFRPRAVLLENVPGILSTGYAPTIIAELAQMGYVGSCGIISAQDAGAPHKRERWWCVPYAQNKGFNWGEWKQSDVSKVGELAYAQHNGHIAATQSRGDEATIYNRKEGQNSPRKFARKCSRGIASKQVMEYAASRRPQKHDIPASIKRKRVNTRESKRHGRNGQTKPLLGRTDHGLPYWLDKPRWPAPQGKSQHDYEAPRTVQTKTPYDTNRIKALGNAVVPQIVYALALEIKKHLSEDETR
jgi:DNA (cytosine-5)-methyltransferase 1